MQIITLLSKPLVGVYQSYIFSSNMCFIQEIIFNIGVIFFVKQWFLLFTIQILAIGNRNQKILSNYSEGLFILQCNVLYFLLATWYIW